ncbi:MAG: hypothetical protein J0H08_07380 [Rhizobiales bacterium]|jgi:hypothetical protein|nr:hypothetical protein [Hyphomicrobiales bacterium]
MSIISDPESWMGLRSARALDGETPPAAEPRTPRRPAHGGLGGMLRRMARFFRRG